MFRNIRKVRHKLIFCFFQRHQWVEVQVWDKNKRKRRRKRQTRDQSEQSHKTLPRKRAEIAKAETRYFLHRCWYILQILVIFFKRVNNMYNPRSLTKFLIMFLVPLPQKNPKKYNDKKVNKKLLELYLNSIMLGLFLSWEITGKNTKNSYRDVQNFAQLIQPEQRFFGHRLIKRSFEPKGSGTREKHRKN